MPSFSSPSTIRVASQDHVLRLKITHNLMYGSPSDVAPSIKGRLPKELDVLWLSDITISLSGSLDGQEILTHDMTRSGLVHHLQMQLKANADRLGLNNVSRPFVDDVDGLSKLTVTPSRPLPDASRPHANLVSLHLAYIWRTVAWRSDTADSGHLAKDINPFSPTLLLPTEMLLNRVTEQLLIYHLVSRYPLVFGPWCRRFDLERHYFPSIGRSIMEVITRSENHRFLSKCKRVLKIARRHHKFTLQTASAALSSCSNDTAFETAEEEADGHLVTPVLTDEQVLCASLEQLFRMGFRQRRFKPVGRAAPKLLQDDEDGLLQQHIPDMWIDDKSCWVELPENATSPLATSSPTSLEDMDVFANEDFNEGGTWCLHGAEVGLGEFEFDTQSDESLISDWISLASINMRPSQTAPVALYHHQDVDPREADPAGSGLRHKISQLAYLEDAETPAVFANLNHSMSHEPRGPYYSENDGQVMGDVGTCQGDSDGFETLESGSDRDEMADSDSILSLEDVPYDADVTGHEEPLV